MDDREYQALKLGQYACFENLRILNLKIQVMEELWEAYDPPFHTRYARRFNELTESDKALKDFRQKIKEIEDTIDEI